MDARMRRDGEIHIIQIFGRLNYEGVEDFAQICENHLVNEKVVFNFEGLNFVGSSGISPFMQVIDKLIKASKYRPRFCGVSSEYKKILETYKLTQLDVFETEFLAVRSFHNTGVFVEDMPNMANSQFGQNQNVNQMPKAVGSEEPIGRAYPANNNNNENGAVDSIIANYIPFTNNIED